MNQQQHTSVEAALRHYKEGIGVFTQKLPEIASSFNAFTEACFEAGALSKKKNSLLLWESALLRKMNIARFTIRKAV